MVHLLKFIILNLFATLTTAYGHRKFEGSYQLVKCRYRRHLEASIHSEHAGIPLTQNAPRIPKTSAVDRKVCSRFIYLSAADREECFPIFPDGVLSFASPAIEYLARRRILLYCTVGRRIRWWRHPRCDVIVGSGFASMECRLSLTRKWDTKKKMDACFFFFFKETSLGSSL